MRHLTVATILFSLAACSVAQPVQVLDSPGRSLSERWELALETADTENMGAYWIGYSIERRMREGTVMGRIINFDRSLPSIAELIDPSEAQPELTVEEAARQAIGRIEGAKTDRLVQKRIALLFKFERGREYPAEVLHSNVSLSIDFDGHPILWLGRASADESVWHLIDRYGEWIGTQTPASAGDGDPESGNLIRDMAEELVGAIGLHQTGAKVAFMIEIAQSSRPGDEREQARFWLGELAGDLVTRGLEVDEPPKVQREALFALSRLDNQSAVTELIQIARYHKNPAIRKQALFWLGQHEDSRALDTIIEIIREES